MVVEIAGDDDDAAEVAYAAADVEGVQSCSSSCSFSPGSSVSAWARDDRRSAILFRWTRRGLAIVFRPQLLGGGAQDQTSPPMMFIMR